MTAANEWTAERAKALDQIVGSFLAEADPPIPTSIDMSGVRAFDTFGAWQLARLDRELKSRGIEVTIVGLPNRYAALFDAVQKSSEEAGRVHPIARLGYSGAPAVGEYVTRAWQNFLLLLNMLGAVSVSALRATLNPREFRLTSTVHHLDRVAWQAVPIILLITFLIGAIIAQQGFFHFRKFGADDYVVDMVGILVLREIGVLIVAIMVAGRSGSSYTAELGSMKMREEIDALRTMGFNPTDVLILPRVIALVIALPILTFLGSMSALYGAELVAWLYGGMSPEIFVARLKEAISITHFKVGMIKAPFMALVIGIVACTEGLKVKGSAESLGLQTTSSVVTSIFLVIVLDGLFAIFFASIGM
ncbi:MlaE family lipid ABC transporter permease subunit [Hyphomicrobium sp.]|uniref:ABC transporter permease n=1 Tax=Hyphomicrobium sp. TaxID=82 RepID=UPI002D786E7D|nr:MlaE family lipid ABC transporter permease subunit [Hyphomicrobium sp.]HET6387933.1 MlaE family lipid ABC transporter permease subunit [Hyphomicrobium sp.]